MTLNIPTHMLSRFSYRLLNLLLLFTIFGCSEADSPGDPIEPEVPVEAVDLHNYIALRNDGTLFSIGGNTGKVSQVGKIPGVEFNIFFNAVTSSHSKIFIYEHYFDLPRGILHIFDKGSGKTQSTELVFPEAEFGEYAGLVALDWDRQNARLIGVVRANLEQASTYGPLKVVSIDPNSFEVNSLGIDLSLQDYENIFSTSLAGQKLYATTSRTDKIGNAVLLEIDLNEKVVQELASPGANLAMTNLGYSPANKELMGFSLVPNSNYMAEARPLILNAQSGSMAEITEVPRFSILNFANKTFYYDEAREFISLVGANNAIHLLKYSPVTGDFELVQISNPENLSSLIAIIDGRKI